MHSKFISHRFNMWYNIWIPINSIDILAINKKFNLFYLALINYAEINISINHEQCPGGNPITSFLKWKKLYSHPLSYSHTSAQSAGRSASYVNIHCAMSIKEKTIKHTPSTRSKHYSKNISLPIKRSSSKSQVVMYLCRLWKAMEA